MSKFNSSLEIKSILETNKGKKLRVKFNDGSIFVLELDHELEREIYGKGGIWLCWIVEAIKSENSKFKELFKTGGGLDIHENDIAIIHDHENEQLLFKAA